MSTISNTSKPYPSGEQFLKLFSTEIAINQLPYMHSYSLDRDIVLYRAMLIILANRLGWLEAHINLADGDDTVSDSDKQTLLSHLGENYDKTARFMSSQAMIALRDNEYHDEHENGARLACYRFLEG